MAKKKQTWKAGDNFVVPLSNGTFGQGQVVTPAERAMDSVVCVFSAAVFKAKPLGLSAPKLSDSIAVLFVTRDLLDSGRWEVLSNEPNTWSADYINLDKLQRNGLSELRLWARPTSKRC